MPPGRRPWKCSGTRLMELSSGLIRNSWPSSVVTHTDPLPAAMSTGVPVMPPITSVAFRVLASIRVTVLSSSLATQMEPKPDVIAAGFFPTGTEATSLFVFGSIAPTALGGSLEIPLPPRVRSTATTAAAMTTAAAAPAISRQSNRVAAADGGLGISPLETPSSRLAASTSSRQVA